MTNSIGVYFSANDSVYNWTLAFLRSFRKYNPEMELWLIPFNEESKKIEELSVIFNFKVYCDNSFVELEKLGEAYELGHTPHGKYWFRRYAAFWGPLEHFIYLDARQVVLSDLKIVLKPLIDGEVDFLYYDLAINQVYEPGPLRKKFLGLKVGRGFNSGRWASRKGIFTQQEILELGYRSLHHRNELNPRNTDQAFINYCVDSKPEIRTAHMAEYLGGFLHQGWAGQCGKIYKKNNDYFLWNYGGVDHKKRAFLLHWAGYNWNESVPQSRILNSFSHPSILTRIMRIIHTVKRAVKSNFYLRKWMGDV